MKTFRLLGMAILMVLACGFFSACGGDEDEDNNLDNSMTKVVIENGKASGDNQFQAINDSVFFINDIEYTIVDDHLEISGYSIRNRNLNCRMFSIVRYRNIDYPVLKIRESSLASIKAETITIPYGVIEIENRAMASSGDINSISIPNTVTKIGDFAFYDCRNLSSIKIPNSVESIGSNAFQWCMSLSTITIPNSVTYLGIYAFYNCNGLSSVVISGITTINPYTFQHCHNLSSVTISNTVTTISEGAFAGCDKLSTIVIPNSVSLISNVAFNGCTNLSTIVIPESVWYIGASAFSECENLSKVTLSKVSSMGKSVFEKCYNLQEIRLKSETPPSCNENPIGSANNNCPIYIPSGSLDAYLAHPVWKSFKHRLWEY